MITTQAPRPQIEYTTAFLGNAMTRAAKIAAARWKDGTFTHSNDIAAELGFDKTATPSAFHYVALAATQAVMKLTVY